ncbi:beta-ketoacyl synthase chain length factor [Bradyrhizobium diazoefficiens]|nr:beta-ketoacyl synthase chain length factor [Bradyrhizobium diazoefficiens]MBR0701961.1 beta-ketoacyl synthase chain length factor [Bradyrhizobium diazoefficiens]MBR0770384.1 beta-ketoacyl synthase chain length factor [Bradyrhizobium diazoefficiens]
MITAFIDSVAVSGPGMAHWQEAAAVLRNPSGWVTTGVVRDNVAGITAAEQRRTTPLIRLALQVAAQLSAASTLDLAKATAVFATSWGDSQVVENVLATLPVPGSPVSPLHFHNIVHNTPAGYWSVGAGARGVSTSLTDADCTVAAGLLEAFVCLANADRPVLFVCFDRPLPASWDQFHHIEAPFAAAMTLTAKPTDRCRHALRLATVPHSAESRMAEPQLESLRTANPAARVLPLLGAVAAGSGRAVLASSIGGSSIAVDVWPVVPDAGLVTEVTRATDSLPA